MTTYTYKVGDTTCAQQQRLWREGCDYLGNILPFRKLDIVVGGKRGNKLSIQLMPWFSLLPLGVHIGNFTIYHDQMLQVGPYGHCSICLRDFLYIVLSLVKR